MGKDLERELRSAYETRVKSYLAKPPEVLESHLNCIRSELSQITIQDLPHSQLIIKVKNMIFRYDLTQSSTIGTGESNDIRLISDFVSRNHCYLIKTDDSWVIKDLRSTNGIYVNKAKVKKAYLKDGDIIQICDVRLIFLR